MDFLKNHGEKILFLVLVVALGLSVVTVLSLQGSVQQDTPLVSRPSNLEMETDHAEEILGLITTNAPEVVVGMETFTASTRMVCVNPEDGSLIPVDLKICPFCGEEQTGVGNDTDKDGIPDTIELKYGMDPNDPTDVFLDQDKDGFFTLYEYERKFDPSDSASHPPLIDYLRLESVDQQSIQFELMGFSQLSNRVYTLQLRWSYPGQGWTRTQYIRTGTRFGANNEFQALRFVERRVQQPDGRWKDESYASLQVGRHLVKLGTGRNDNRGKVTESQAVLHLIAGPDWQRDIRIGNTFELDKKSYKVIDILKDTVVIKADDSDSTQSIERATPEEIEELTPEKPDEKTGEGGDDAIMPPDDFFPQF